MGIGTQIHRGKAWKDYVNNGPLGDRIRSDFTLYYFALSF